MNVITSSLRSKLFSMACIENTDLYLLINIIMNDSSSIKSPLDSELHKIFKR